MNAADHLALGEQALEIASATPSDIPPDYDGVLLLRALVHMVAAVAIELGVPPVAAPAGGDSSG